MKTVICTDDGQEYNAWSTLPRVAKFRFGRASVFVRHEGKGTLLLYSSETGLATFCDARIFLGLADWVDTRTPPAGPVGAYTAERFSLIGLTTGGLPPPRMVRVIPA